MFWKKNDSKPLGRIDSLIGAGTRVEGSAVEGASSSVLVLSEHARIEGAVSVAHLVTNGTVVGPVSVTQSIEMQSKARIVGDLQYASIEMHQGAVIEGRLLHAAVQSEELIMLAPN